MVDFFAAGIAEPATKPADVRHSLPGLFPRSWMGWQPNWCGRPEITPFHLKVGIDRFWHSINGYLCLRLSS
jgi:hypothetical protein